VAGDYNSLGGAWSSKGEYDKAIEYYEKALQINVRAFGDQHPNLAVDYRSLGGAWSSKGEYDKAIEYYEKALQINVRSFLVTNILNGWQEITTASGSAWSSKGEYDKAIGYYEKALQINVRHFATSILTWQEITTASVECMVFPKGNTTKRLSIMKKRYKST
jgi:tetratricopeptide (TPR) repeat protein